MYLTGGQFKGRKIEVPTNVKPTLSKVRESVFNILLQYELSGNKFLNMFSGSAIMGLEAISRGAKSATFIDNNDSAINCIKSNIDLLKENDKCTVLKDDFHIISSLGNFDIILLDPPYSLDVIDEIIEIIEKNNLLSNIGIIVYESDEKHSIKKDIPGYNVKVKKYGISYVNILYKL